MIKTNIPNIREHKQKLEKQAIQRIVWIDSEIIITLTRMESSKEEQTT